jgi:thioredoxin-related protein
MKYLTAFFTATIVIMILGAAALADNNQTEAIKWLGFDAAQQQGNAANDKYFIYFKSESCGYCRKLEKNAFSNSDVISYINENFVPVRVDLDQEPKLARRYRVQGVPDLRFLSPEGVDIARWPGYAETDHLLALLKFVHTDSYKKMNFTEFMKSMNP